MTCTPGETPADIARLIVESGAVYIRAGGEPFFFTSGWASPVFIDLKKLISLSGARSRLISAALARIANEIGPGAMDLVAGCELAGVPFAAILADRLNLPLVVVRKQGKGFGRLSQFEGAFETGARALLVDDLSTDGVSKSSFRGALETAGALVVGTFVFLDYGVFGGERKLTSLVTLSDVIEAAGTTGRLSGTALEEVRSFAANASDWSRRNGGLSALPDIRK